MSARVVPWRPSALSASVRPTIHDLVSAPRLVALALSVAAVATSPLHAQYAAELEVEHGDGATTTRVELLTGGFYVLRAEQERENGENTERLGVQMPGTLLGLDGYASVFVQRRPRQNGVGTNFDLGRGLVALGGSLEPSVRAAFARSRPPGRSHRGPG